MSLLNQITPVILTFNEAPNIGRCLEGLSWAKDIVVVDSHSTDETEEICRRYPQVRWFNRSFDNHASQWNFATQQTSIQTEWILALDADYMLPGEAVHEIARLQPAAQIAAYWLKFHYAVLGRRLRSGIYPPVLALFRRSDGRYIQDGHTQRLVVSGATGRLSSPLVHDDRKSFDHWVRAQYRYAELEADKLIRDKKGVKAWIRTHTPFSPLIMGFYCLIVRGALLEGRAGWLYSAQRTLAEAMILVSYLDKKLRQ